MLWYKSSVHCEFVLLSLVNKGADFWPIARLNKARLESQMKIQGERGVE